VESQRLNLVVQRITNGDGGEWNGHFTGVLVRWAGWVIVP
jgi:hypothetical protein